MPPISGRLALGGVRCVASQGRLRKRLGDGVVVPEVGASKQKASPKK